jgi:hypothetical protein
MSIVRVYRTFKGESASAQGEVQRYLVETDDPNTSCTEARTADDGQTAIPEQYSGLEGTTWTADVTAKRMDQNPKWFEVLVTYSAPKGDFGKEIKPDDGKKWNRRISGRTVIWEEEVFKARPAFDPEAEEVTISNSAGQRFPNGVKQTYYDEEFIVDFYTDDPDWDAIDEARGRVNSVEIALTVKGVSRIFPIGTLRFIDCHWSQTWEYATTAEEPDIQMSYSFHYRPTGWQLRIVDEGHNAFDDSTTSATVGAFTPIVDQLGEPTPVPVFLDGNGGALPPGDPAVLIDYWLVDVSDFEDLLDGITDPEP